MSISILVLGLLAGVFLGVRMERRRSERERESRIAEIGRGKLKNF